MTDTIFPDTSIEQDVFQSEQMDFALSPSSETASLCEHGQHADALLVVYADINARVIESLDRCKVIVRAGIGYNNVDVEAASRKGIIVANVPDYCHDEVADHTFALFLALTRKICTLNAQVRQGGWDANLGKNVPQLKGKSFGLLGCGAIGQQVATRARAFGMKVIGFDPYRPEDFFTENSIARFDDLENFLREVDYLSLHVPLTDATRNIINTTALEIMKSSAVIINTSRGGLVHEEDLYDALMEERIAGAALDVLEREPPEAAPALSRLDNVIITPHTAFLSADSVAALRTKASQEIVRVIKSGGALNPIN